MRTLHQRHGRTDGRTTYDSNTALALRASRGKNSVLRFFGKYPAMDIRPLVTAGLYNL